MMLIEDKFALHAEIAAEYPETESHQALAHEAAKQASQDLSLRFAIDITVPADAFVVTVVREVKEQNVRLVGAILDPNPAEGVELVDGPKDGEILRVNRDSVRQTPLSIRLSEYRESEYKPDAIAPQSFPFETLNYQRVGINLGSLRWVYKFKP